MRLSAILVFAATLFVLPARAETPPAFTAPLERDHPLVGKIWQPASQNYLSAEALAEQALGADMVLLGETHDNADHHALQAWMVRWIMTGPTKPQVAFEMLDSAQSPALATYLSQHPHDAEGVAAAVEWEKSGWPDWRMYRPIAQAALDGGAILAAANLSRDDTKIIAKGNIPTAWTGKLGLEKPQDPADRQAMEEDIQAGHCNMLPARALPAMVRVQRARDAAMAWTLSQAPRSVLIAGAGHVRADRAVPRHLAEMAPSRTVLTVAFVEVIAGKPDPATYAAIYETDRLPFDAVWFTPRAEREDQCEAFRQHMDKKKD